MILLLWCHSSCKFLSNRIPHASRILNHTVNYTRKMANICITIHLRFFKSIMPLTSFHSNRSCLLKMNERSRELRNLGVSKVENENQINYSNFVDTFLVSRVLRVSLNTTKMLLICNWKITSSNRENNHFVIERLWFKSWKQSFWNNKSKTPYDRRPPNSCKASSIICSASPITWI